MASGKNHSDIKRVVSIIVTNYTLIPENKHYHNKFRYRSDKDGAEFTNLTEINTLELSKLPPDADNTELWYWMKFIKSDDEEVLDMLAQRSPQMRKAVGVLKELSADERTRMLYEEREIARRDIASMVDGAKRVRSIEIAENLLGMNMPLDQIVTATGLTREEVENLHTTTIKWERR